MEKVIKKIGIIVLVWTTLCSCSNEPVDQNVLLLRRIVQVAVDGTSTTTTLNYNGNKIVSLDKAEAYLEFYYTGSLITKIVETDKKTSNKNILDYTYVDGVLNKIVSSENYVINYKQNKDGSVSYEKWNYDSNKAVKDYYGTLFFQNENLVKEEKIIEDATNRILITKVVNIVFDNKKNALDHILGFDKLFDFAKVVSPNNGIISVESSSEKHLDDDQIISSIKRLDSKIQYNSEGYPTEIVSENRFFGEVDAKHLKSQLFYN